MKLLMHTCCAPCSIYCIETLEKEKIKPAIYWYNPNIHPYTEYKARKEALQQYTTDIVLSLIIEEEYGLKKFVKNTIDNLDKRCTYCYKTRLEQTAKYAKQNEYDAFTTTLLISPYQNHDLLKQIGEELAKKYDIKFLYKDFREGFRKGQEKAKQLGLYRQKYCGCIFSEEDRYSDRIQKDKKKFK